MTFCRTFPPPCYPPYRLRAGGAYIAKETVRKLQETGFVKDCYLEAGFDGRLGKGDGNRRVEQTFFGVSDLEQFTAETGAYVRLHLGEGFEDVAFVEP